MLLGRIVAIFVDAQLAAFGVLHFPGDDEHGLWAGAGFFRNREAAHRSIGMR